MNIIHSTSISDAAGLSGNVNWPQAACRVFACVVTSRSTNSVRLLVGKEICNTTAESFSGGKAQPFLSLVPAHKLLAV